MFDTIITIIGAAVLICLWFTLYDSNRFVVVKHRIKDSRIRKGCRAVVLADLHNKRYGKDNSRLIGAVRDCKPDLILIAGDILTAKPGKNAQTALSLLGELAKEFPVYYGNGNHEQRLKLYPEKYGEMAQEYEAALKKMGVRLLVNAHTDLPEEGISVYGAEIDRRYYKRCRAQSMETGYLEGILGKPSMESYTVLLAHNPDYFPQYACWGADLTLSGHVHGGIVRVPFWGKGIASPKVRLFPKYDGGRFVCGSAVMLLSRGLGMHTIPIRLFNPGELLVVDFAGEEKGNRSSERT